MKRRRFAEKFAEQAGKMNRLLVGLLIFGFCLLTTVQMLLLQPQARNYLSYVHRAEGEEIPTGPVLNESEMHVSITLLESGPNPAVKILVNDQPVGDFRENPIFVPVNFGDTVAVDGTQVTGVIRFRLGSLPSNVDSDSLVTTGECHASVFCFGRLVRRAASP